MRRTLLYVIMCAAALAGRADEENRASAVGRNLELFNEIYKQLDVFYVDTLSADTVIGWGIRGMLRRVDPFTDYYAEDDEELRQMATGKYAGIGSVIRYHRGEERAAISEPYEHTPSQRAGLEAGDLILSVDGKDVRGLSTARVSQMLRGEAGTSLELRVRRGGEELTFHITRETIQTPQVPYYGMAAPGAGYIALTGFTEGAAREVAQALGELRRAGAERLVLDLRGNPGGSVSEAVDIAALFLPKGTLVVSTKGKMAATNREYRTAGEPADSLMPVAVLVDGASASASEIVAGCLQDMDRAVVVGERTYGKGLVQMVRELPYHGSLKITTSRYHIPSGRCIQAYDYRHPRADGSPGIVPDSLTRAFRTRGGRPVRDGGGIKPDVEVAPDSLPALVLDLAESDEFFDYATAYCREHPDIAPAGEFTLSDSDYAAFTDYMRRSTFTYSRPLDGLLDELDEALRREGCQETAGAELRALRAKLSTGVADDVARLRSRIQPLLEEEIVARRHFLRGAVRQQMRDDPALARALRALSGSEYGQILGR